MMQKPLKGCLGLAALLLAAICISSGPAHAVSIGTLPIGTPFADVIESPGPNFSRDYNFHLEANTEVTVLADAQAQTSDHFAVNALTISLFDAAHTLLATDTGVPLASFDSLNQTGVGLAEGDYLLRVFGTVPPTFRAFVKVALAANASGATATPIPGAVIMLLTALGGLGSLGAIRRYFPGAPANDLAG
jgi:hypothetical protein